MMKLKNQVCSLKLAEKLKKLGYPQKGLFWWSVYYRGANLREANLRGADLRGAELDSAKFYGKGGTVKLKKDQVEDFLNALGFMVED